MYECTRGVKVPRSVRTRLLELLESIQWKSKREAVTTSARKIGKYAEGSHSLVLGATRGAAGSAGFGRVIKDPVHGSQIGINTQVVPRKFDSSREALLELWQICKKMLKVAEPGFSFSSIQVNKNFYGSPHVDKHDVTHQYALSLGNFTGGRLVTGTDDPRTFVSFDTHDVLTKCDGRNPHWVTPYKGARYSLIFYRITGRKTPRNSASRSGVCGKLVPSARAAPRRAQIK